MTADVQGTMTQEMLQLVEEYFQEEDLVKMLQAFIVEKAEEGGVWSSLTRSTHYMLGGSSIEIDRAAALTEIFVLLSDIVDDLQDRDNFQKVWMRYPEAEVLSAVLALHAIVIAELPKLGIAPRWWTETGKLLARAIDGQHWDVKKGVHSEEAYIAMVTQKSGSLIRLALMMGYALVDDLKQEVIDRLNELADCIGIAAQLTNDIRDVTRWDEKSDLLMKKRTLPILFMLQDSPEEFPVLAQYYEGEVSTEQFLAMKADCLQFIGDSGCIEYSQVIRGLCADKAQELLEAIPGISPWKERFEELAVGQFQCKAKNGGAIA